MSTVLCQHWKKGLAAPVIILLWSINPLFWDIKSRTSGLILSGCYILALCHANWCLIQMQNVPFRVSIRGTRLSVNSNVDTSTSTLDAHTTTPRSRETDKVRSGTEIKVELWTKHTHTVRQKSKV